MLSASQLNGQQQIQWYDLINLDRIEWSRQTVHEAGIEDRITCHVPDCAKKLKRVKIYTNWCRCGNWFCDQHLWYLNHRCQFD